MRALTITRHGGPEVLEVREAATPTPTEGHVLVRVVRAGLNFADVMARVGLYPDAPKPPVVMGYEVAGTIEALGPGVTQFTLGQRVASFCHFGGQATHILIPVAQVIPMPDAMTFDDAAALPVNYVTAFHILFHVGQLRPHDRVLIHMAAGGVGQAAIQLCRLVEGVEIFGTASAKKHAQLREAGVQHPIDYNTQDYAEVVKSETQGRGLQWVLDPLGGKDWTKGYGLLAPGGRLAAYGWSNMVSGTKRNLFHLARQALSLRRYSPVKLMGDNRAIIGVNMGQMWGEGEMIGRHMASLFSLHAEGKIRPVLDKVFPLSQGAEAHNRLQDRLNVGKVLFDGA